MSALTRKRRHRRSLRLAQLWEAITRPSTNPAWRNAEILPGSPDLLPALRTLYAACTSPPAEIKQTDAPEVRYLGDLNRAIFEAYQSSPPVTL